MVQTRDKIAASLVVAAMVAFGVVVAAKSGDVSGGTADRRVGSTSVSNGSGCVRMARFGDGQR